jgi:hypothetical protein
MTIHRLSRVTRAAVAFAALITAGLLMGGAAPSAQAAGAAPSLTVSPATGNYQSGTATISTSGLNCPDTGGLTTVAFPILTTRSVALPLTVAQGNDLLAPSDPTDAANTIWSTDAPGPESGDVSSATAFPGSGWSDSTTFAAVDLSGFLSAHGSGQYTLALLCADGASGAAIDDGSGNAMVAATTLTIDVTAHTWTFVAPADATATTLAATPIAGGGATLTATVTDTTKSSATPTGGVQFSAGGTVLNTTPATVDGTGKATYTATATDLPVGTHSVLATFTPADGAFAGSASAAQDVVVTDKSGTQVTLSATPTGTEVDLSATVQLANGTTVTAAAGTVDFAETSGTGWTKTGVAVADGVAQTSDTGLTPGTKYTFTATYKATTGEAFRDSAASDPQDATVPSADQNGTLTDGGTVQPGTDYDVSFPATTFGNGHSVTVVLHSDPVTLTPGTAGADGSLKYTFSAPSTLVAGDSHTLVFTDAADPTKTATIAFTVAAVSGAGDPGSNDPSSFLTDWTRSMTATPQGIAGLIGGLVLALAAAIGGWAWYWRRRRAAQDQQQA